jgi:hypothetical protein
MPQTRRFPIYDFGRSVVTPWVAAIALCASACGADPASETSKGEYDPVTGRLLSITYDRDGNGRIDTWTKMDGTRPVSSEIDTNEDGVIDRWEEYDDAGRLVRAGWIRGSLESGPTVADPDAAIAPPRAPTPDTWLYPSPDGRTSRIDHLDRDNEGREIITRREFYEGDLLVRVEEDKDGDGVMDQWETWVNGVLRSVEFDDGADGRPDRRFTYENGQLVLIESEPDASGVYTRRVVPGGR